MSALELALMAQIIANSIDIQRLDATERAKVLALLGELESNLKQVLATRVLSEMGKQATNSLLREVNALIQEAYTEAAMVSQATALELAPIEAKATMQALERVLSVTIGKGSTPSATYLEKLASDVLIQGSPTANYWSKQAGDVAFRFAAELRQGLVAGESNQEIVSRVIGTKLEPGVMNIARKNAATLVHSSVQTVANSARLATYRKNADIIKGVRWLATLDSHTCESCAPRDGEWWDLEGVPQDGNDLPFAEPPMHVGCRCVLTPVIKTYAEQGIDMPEIPVYGQRASSDGPVAPGTTFAQWFAGRTKDQQDEQFGPGKAAMYRAGKLNLRDMVDGSGSPLTLAELKAKYK